MDSLSKALYETHLKTKYSTHSKGEEKTTSFRLFFNQTRQGKDEQVSPWHDIPLVANKNLGTFNMIVEIPRGDKAKLELSKEEEGNPIKQDIKNGKLRYIADVNGATGYIVNYGAFPQTWEDPHFVHPDTGCKGDNDPLDVCEIGSQVATVGQVKEVKVLGCLAMIDEGETDWKVIAVDVKDELAHELNDISDLEAKRPGFIHKLYEWFRDYKIPDGKPPNKFAFEGKPKDKAFTLSVVEENHAAWRNKYFAYSSFTKGDAHTTDFRVFLTRTRNGQTHTVSPWHHIPFANTLRNTFNMLVEIPAGETAKLEVSKTEEHNPIKQDIKNGKLRYIAPVNGSTGYIVNYGAFPQTWEDPSFVHPDTNAKGDNDPLDVCEIGSIKASVGEVKEVKVLGSLAMIDEGETDWKVIAIDVKDPLAAQLHDIQDLEAHRPGFMNRLYEWFRDYKIPDGKPPNKFAFEGKPKNKEYTLRVIAENHEAWQHKYH